MTKKKGDRGTSKASKSGTTAGELAERLFARLNCSLEQRGNEIFDRVWAEWPFTALVKLTQVLDRRAGEPNDFDRRRNREQVVERLTRREVISMRAGSRTPLLSAMPTGPKSTNYSSGSRAA
jgi:hypothetical protein